MGSPTIRPIISVKRAKETILGQADGGVKILYRCWKCDRLLSISNFAPGVYQLARRNIGITETVCDRKVYKDGKWERCRAKNDLAVRINFFD